MASVMPLLDLLSRRKAALAKPRSLTIPPGNLPQAPSSGWYPQKCRGVTRALCEDPEVHMLCVGWTHPLCHASVCGLDIRAPGSLQAQELQVFVSLEGTLVVKEHRTLASVQFTHLLGK